MRQTTKKAVQAFMADTPINLGNTSVTSNESGITIMQLFGNEIARKNWNGNGEIEISNAGYFTATTKERLNGLPSVRISQVKGVWLLNNKQWDGKWTKVD